MFPYKPLGFPNVEFLFVNLCVYKLSAMVSNYSIWSKTIKNKAMRLEKVLETYFINKCSYLYCIIWKKYVLTNSC